MGIRDSLQKLKGYLTSPSSDYVAATGQFLELDGRAMARNLKLEKEGKSRGKVCQPPATASSLDSVEQNITSTVSADVARNQEILKGHLNSFGARVSQLQLDKVPEMRNEVLTVIGDFNNLISDGLDSLRIERRGVVDLDDEFKLFKSENKLFRTAVYPTAKVWHWATIFALILLESVLNGIMLGQGVERGLVGGVGYALGIAFLNVFIIGWFLGETFRWAHHVRPTIKFFSGYIPIVVLIIVAVGLNLTVAHFRDALGDPSVVSPERYALDRLFALDKPADATSGLLFLLGLGFCIFAGIDFLKMDDRYPRYGDLDRRRDEKERDYGDFKGDQLEHLSVVRDETTETMTELRDGVQRKKGEYLVIVDHRILVFEQFDRSVEHNQNVANQLLSIYRDANILARPEGCSVPNYFSEYQEVSRIAVQGRDHSEHNIDKLNDDANAVREALMEGIDRVHEEFKNAQETYRRIDQLTKEELELEIRQSGTDS